MIQLEIYLSNYKEYSFYLFDFQNDQQMLKDLNIINLDYKESINEIETVYCLILDNQKLCWKDWFAHTNLSILE